jgi:hypothetical protein
VDRARDKHSAADSSGVGKVCRVRFPPIMPVQDRPLSADERHRVHAGILEVESAISLLPVNVEGYGRMFWVQASTMNPPGAADVHLIPPRPKPVTAESEVMRWREVVLRWWRGRS